MFGYWKEEYQRLAHASSRAIEGLLEHMCWQDKQIARLERELKHCRQHGVVVADALSLSIQICNITIKSTNMSMTIPVKKVVIATLKGVETATGKEGPITEGEISATDPSILLVEPVLDTDNVTVIPNKKKITTLKEGTASLSFSAKNANGSLLSGTDDWTVTPAETPVVVDSLNISYGTPTDVTP